MKKWFYVLFPTALLGLFLIFYLSSVKETEAKEEAHRVEMAKEKADADAKKAAAESIAKSQCDCEDRSSNAPSSL